MLDRISLKQYVTDILAEKEKALNAALVASDKRLDGMNEFRDSLKDQAGTFVTRKELEAIEHEIGMLREMVRVGQTRYMTVISILGLLGLFAGIILPVLRHP
jgi:hypothetical protein